MDAHDLSELRGFLREATPQIYSPDKNFDLTEDLLCRYIYSGKNFEIRNFCTGSKSFIGQKIVYDRRCLIGSRPFWGMNYRGGIWNGYEDSESVYKFLTEALKHPDPGPMPVRGLQIFTQADWIYKLNFRVNEDGLERFVGEESIVYRSHLVYHCTLQGGLIRE